MLRLSSLSKYFWYLSLLEKLYSILNLTEYDTVTVSQFVSGFLKMDEEIRKSRDELNEEYSNKKKNSTNIIRVLKTSKNQLCFLKLIVF